MLFDMMNAPMPAPPIVHISNGTASISTSKLPPENDVAAEHAAEQQDEGADRQHCMGSGGFRWLPCRTQHDDGDAAIGCGQRVVWQRKVTLCIARHAADARFLQT